MTHDKTGGPAFPAQPKYETPGAGFLEHDQGGMTLRQYAAIKLRVPDSGTDWLDDMIRQAKRDDLVGQALIGAFHNATDCHGPIGFHSVAKDCFCVADAMLREREETTND